MKRNSMTMSEIELAVERVSTVSVFEPEISKTMKNASELISLLRAHTDPQMTHEEAYRKLAYWLDAGKGA